MRALLATLCLVSSVGGFVVPGIVCDDVCVGLWSCDAYSPLVCELARTSGCDCLACNECPQQRRLLAASPTNETRLETGTTECFGKTTCDDPDFQALGTRCRYDLEGGAGAIIAFCNCTGALCVNDEEWYDVPPEPSLESSDCPASSVVDAAALRRVATTEGCRSVELDAAGIFAIEDSPVFVASGTPLAFASSKRDVVTAAGAPHRLFTVEH